MPTPPPTVSDPEVVLVLSVVPVTMRSPVEVVPVVLILLAPVLIDPNPGAIDPLVRTPTPVNDDPTIVDPNSVVVNNDVPSNNRFLPAASSIPLLVNVAIVLTPH